MHTVTFSGNSWDLYSGRKFYSINLNQLINGIVRRVKGHELICQPGTNLDEVIPTLKEMQKLAESLPSFKSIQVIKHGYTCIIEPVHDNQGPDHGN